MKFLRLLTILLLSVSVITCQQKQDEQPPTQLAVPIKLVDGYGPFPPGFSKLKNEVQDGSEISKMALPLRGLPQHWASVQRNMVWLNLEQLVYQNFLAGTISPAWYEGAKAPQGWHLAQDETRLSKKPLKCYVYVIWGFDTKTGKWLAMVDTNNNLDFSDETAFEPKVIKPATLSKPDPAASKVQYEVYQHGKIETRSIPMVVGRSGDDLFYNFPQHALATFERDGRTYELAVSYGLTRPDFEETYLTQPPTWFWQDNVNPEDIVELQQNITLGGVTYKNKGVDLYNNVLRLEPLSPDKKEYSLQVGYPFRPFTEKEFGSGKPISLANYRGKYVYVDFWGTWCKGCVEDMPALKQIYQKLDKDRFAFVGIVAKDSPERLAAFVKKQGIGWPQIFSDDQNKLVDAYLVTGYPTSVLLDPNGTVIAKNLRPEALQAKIAELSR